MHYPDIKELATQFRRNPTAAEITLWRYLRRRQLGGRKFLRQHPIVYQITKTECFFYIPDFYCHEEMLAVELDGPVHEDRVEKDQIRDQILLAKGIRTLRIRNEDLVDIEKALLRIRSSFRKL